MDLLYGFIFSIKNMYQKGFSAILIKSFEVIYLKLQQNMEIGNIAILLYFMKQLLPFIRQISSTDCTSTEILIFFQMLLFSNEGMLCQIPRPFLSVTM